MSDTPTSKHTQELRITDEYCENVVNEIAKLLDKGFPGNAAVVIRREIKKAHDASIAAKRTELAANWPEKKDEHFIDPEDGRAVETYGYEAEYNSALDAAWQAVERCYGEGK